MRASLTASEHELCTLAGIVSETRPDLPAEGGLPESLLADLMGQIRCDEVVFIGFDSGRQANWFAQEVPFTDTPGGRTLTGRTGGITGIASSAATLAAPATCAASSRSRTSTRPGNGIPPPCTPITSGRAASSTF